MMPHEGLYSSCQNNPTTAMDIIIGSNSSVVSRPLAGILRFSNSATPKPTSTCPPTDTSTYLAVIVKLVQMYGSASRSRYLSRPMKCAGADVDARKSVNE